MAGPTPRSAIRVSAGSAGWKSVPLVICDDGSTSRAIHSRGQPCAGGTTKSTGKSPRMQSAKSAADRQLPIGDEILLDHVGHFVRDPEAATRALVRAGFAPTPVSIQVNPEIGR